MEQVSIDSSVSLVLSSIDFSKKEPHSLESDKSAVEIAAIHGVDEIATVDTTDANEPFISQENFNNQHYSVGDSGENSEERIEVSILGGGKRSVPSEQTSHYNLSANYA